MTCPNCGRISPAGTAVCPACGATLIVEMPADVEPLAEPTQRAFPDPPVEAPAPPWPPPAFEPAPPEPPTAPAEAPLVYAGFWRRWTAAFLDGIVLWALSVPFFVLWILPTFGMSPEQFEGMTYERQMEVGGSYLLYGLICLIVEMMYFALFESSRRRATLGRMALGIQVVDTHGQRIHLGRALGRRLARILSSLTLGIGFLVQLFTRRRQALHDLIAGTLVVRDLP